VSFAGVALCSGSIWCVTAASAERCRAVTPNVEFVEQSDNPRI
jgi:hypothetical protein